MRIVMRYMSQFMISEMKNERGLILKGKCIFEATQSKCDVMSRLNKARWTAMVASGSNVKHSS